MTRINVVPPSELCDKHLLAEYRELPRVFALARPCPDAPKEYVLGAGHVKFFYDKLGFLARRFKQLAYEAQARGFKPSYVEAPFREDAPELYGEYFPTKQAITLNRARIAERRANFKRPQ